MWGETDRGQDRRERLRQGAGLEERPPSKESDSSSCHVTSCSRANLSDGNTSHRAHRPRRNVKWKMGIFCDMIWFHISHFFVWIDFFNLITSPYSGEFSHRIPWLLLQENKKTGILQILCKLILIFTSNYNKSWILAFVSFVIRGLLMVSESWESSQLSGVKYF